MSISLTRFFLPLVLLLAFLARFEPARTLRLAPDERDLGASRWLIDDPDTCQRLRRVELALAGNSITAFDRFVNHPRGGEIPALPLFDTMTAGLAQRILRKPTSDLALGQVDEADLEDFVIKLSPILGLLCVLATWWAVRSFVGGPRGDAAALLGAAVVALHPATIAATSAGALSALSLACILFALLIRSVTRSVSAEALPGWLLDALVAGGLSGLLCACTSVGFVLFLPAWGAFLFRAVRARGDARAKAMRAGLIFCVVAAFVGRLPLNEGPWEEGAGMVRGFVRGVSMILFLSASPYLVMMILPGAENARAFRTVCFTVALGLMLWQLPQTWRDLAPAVKWCVQERPLLRGAVSDPDSRTSLAFNLLMFPVIPAAFLVLQQARSPASLGLVLFAAATAIAAQIFPPAAPAAVVAAACLLARAFDLWFDRGASQPRFQRAVWLGFVVLLLAAWAAAPWMGSQDEGARQERITYAAGLRWMRNHTDSGGPWNSPQSPSSWGVLSTVADGPLVHYHARRAAVVSPWAAWSGPRSVERASNAWWEEPARLERFLREARVRYLLVPGEWHHWQRDPAPPRAAQKARHDRWRTLSAPPGDSGIALMGLERVHSAGLVVDPSNNPIGSVLTLWRVDEAVSEPVVPQMRPR